MDEEFNKISLRMQELNEELKELDEKRRKVKEEQTILIAKWNLISTRIK